MNVGMLSYSAIHNKGALVLEGFYATFSRSIDDVLRMLLSVGYHVSDDPYRDGYMTTFMFDYTVPMTSAPALSESELIEGSQKATLYCFDDGTGTFNSIGMNMEYVGDRELIFDMLSATGWSIFNPADASYKPVKGETVYNLFRKR